MRERSPDLFDGLAAVYERGRPGYARESIAWVAEQLALGPGSLVADVGAGTGKLTRHFLELHADVVAIEPVEDMRNQFATLLPGAKVLAATAESLPFGDATLDAIVVGTAFHWFDAARALSEFSRVLREGGGVAIFLNYPDPEQPVAQALAEIWQSVRRRSIRFEMQDDSGRFATGAKVFAPSPRFGEVEEATFAFAHRLTRAQLTERFASFASIAALPKRERTETLRQVRKFAMETQEPIDCRTFTNVSIARLRR